MIKAVKNPHLGGLTAQADRPVEFRKEDKSMMEGSRQPGGVPTQLIEEE
ncbi:hypothetical protein [Sporomusa acidovorans]|nr:hypothetical protein [Sporomusa acidovorans]SDD74260.1 hypothetical protein SAMN04488499_1003225 [Sporomusa acidovorans]